MLPLLKTNNIDFSLYAKEEGIVQTDVDRISREVITRSGKKYQVRKTAKSISFESVTLSDSTYNTLIAELQERVVSFQFLDTTTGQTRTADFFVYLNGCTAKTVVCGTTYYTGLNFTLEEVL